MLTFTLCSAMSQACSRAKRRIGLAHDPKSFVVRGKLRLGAARPRPRARLSRSLPPRENFVDIAR
jgi:hypothetical protein